MLYDISPPISESFPVWPQQPFYKKTKLTDMHQGSSCTAFSFLAPSHIGAVAVAPSHVGFKAASIDQMALHHYIGTCQVIHVEVQPGRLIREPMLPVDIRAERVLIATNTFNSAREFQRDFAALDVSLIEELGKRGVVLVGIDTPSIDLFHDSTLFAHRKALEYNIAILEGLDLKEVPDGIYELIALPLKLTGLDASPVRAILRS